MHPNKLTTLIALATLFMSPGSFAGSGHDHGPKYGGVVREVRQVAYELVAKPDSLTIYVSDHGKPISTDGAKGEATIYAGNNKTTVALAPAGENRLSAKGDFKTGIGVTVAAAVTLPGKETARINFKLK